MPRLLIGNDFDAYLFKRKDVRAWAHRGLWFATGGDVFLFASDPEPCFVKHVSEVIQKDLTTECQIKSSKMLNPDGVIDINSALDSGIREVLMNLPKSVESIYPLFPSAFIAQACSEFDFLEKIAGGSFLQAGGGEVANSKSTFRLASAVSGAQSARGSVCRSMDELRRAMTTLLLDRSAVMVKQSHAGAGAGNEVVHISSFSAPDDIGALHRYAISDIQSVKRYCESRWKWASGDGRFPVVVEELLHVKLTCYYECELTDNGVLGEHIGLLTFGDNRLLEEKIEPSVLTPAVELLLRAEALKLAKYYWNLGYRGPWCADAVVTPEEAVFLTEVNARTTTSTHLHTVFKKLTAGAEVRQPHIGQYMSEKNWGALSTREVLTRLKKNSLIFDAKKGEGVVLTMPATQGDAGGGFLYAVLARDERNRDSYRERVRTALRRA